MSRVGVRYVTGVSLPLMPTVPPHLSKSDAVGRFLVVIGLTRWIGNVLIRFPYVMITPIAAGLGISIPTATVILGIRELGGMASPVAGGLADRGHERFLMVGLGMTVGLSSLGIAFGPPLWLFAALLFLGGTAKFGYDTTQSAWIGHRVPFHRRGATFGLIETGWAFAFLIGGPLCAWLTVEFGWRAPFGAVGIAALLGTAVVWMKTDRDRPDAAAPAFSLRTLVAWRPPSGVNGLYAFAFVQPCCQMFIFAIAGDWFVSELGMSLSGVGWNTMLIGLSELVGTLSTVWTADRFGKRRGAITGLLIVVPAAAALGLVGNAAPLGIALLCVIAAGLEFSFVSALPLFSEVDPDARAAALGSMIAITTFARAGSAALAGWVFVQAGIGVIGLVAAGLALAGVASLAQAREPAPTTAVTRRS